MDVETLNVVLDATYAPAVRGLATADAAFERTTVAARGTEAATAELGNTVTVTGGKASSAAREHEAHAGAIKDAEKEARGATSAFTGMGRAMSFASNAFIAGAGIGYILKAVYEDTTKLQDAQSQLANVVNNTGGSWTRQGAAIRTYVGNLSDLSKFSPADLTNDFTRLDGVTQSVSKSERDLSLATNISRSTHKGLDTVVRALTLAEAGRTTGLSRLGIVLPKITTQQDALKAKLAALKAQGLQVSAAVKDEATARAKAADGVVAYGIAVDGLTKKYGNADKVFGNSSAGKVADLRKNFEDLATSVGTILVPEIDKGVTGLDDWFAAMTKSGQAQKDVKEGIDAIGDGFRVVVPIVEELTGLVGGFQNALEIALGIYGAKLLLDFGKGLVNDAKSAIAFGKSIYGIGVKAAGIVGNLLGISGSSDAATESVDAGSKTMQESIDALNASIQDLVLTMEGIPAEAATATSETDAQFVVMGSSAEALQLKITGVSTAFADIPAAAATAAAETDTSLVEISDAATVAAADVTSVETALAGLGPAAAAGAAEAGGVLSALGALTASTFAAAAAGAAAVVASSGAAPNVKGLPKGSSAAAIAKLAESGKIPKSVLQAAAKKAHISPDTPAGNALSNPAVLKYLTAYATAHGMVVPATSGGLTGAMGTPGAPNPGFQVPGLGKTPLTPAEKAAAKQKQLQAQAAKAQKQFQAEAAKDEAAWQKLIAGGTTPIVKKPTQLDQVLPTGRQSALEAAKAAAANGGVAAEKHLVDVAQQQLDYLNKEHASGQELVVLERERASLAGVIAAAHKKISSEMLKQTKTAVGRKEEKILGLGANGSQTTPGAVSLRMSEHKILDNAIAKMFGGSKHSLQVAAQNLGLSTSTLLHDTNQQLIDEMKKLGVDLPTATLDSLNKVNEVLKNKFLPPDVSANIRARLQQIEQTLNSGMTALSNMKPVKSTDLVKGLGLDAAEKKALESRIAQEMAHGGKVPAGRAADGVPLSGSNTTITIHAPVTIHGGDTKTARQLAKELAPAMINELAKHQLRRAGGT